MGWLTDILFRLKAILSPKRMNRELDEEVAFHLEMETRKHLQRGMTPGDARRQAIRNFGDVERQKQRTRDAWAVGLVQRLRTDLRLGFRQLRTSPLFAATSILTLALGIGATTAMFSVVHSVLVRPLPFDAPDRVVRMSHTMDGQPWRFTSMSYPNIVDWRDRTDVFEGVSILHGWRATLSNDRGPVELRGASVSAAHFDLLGVRPAIGRFFRPEEDIPGHEPVVVLSYATWQRHFGGDEDVIGSSVVLTDLRDEEAGTSYVIIGVAPQDFETPLFSRTRFEIWRSTQAYYTEWNRGNNAVYAMGRIRAGLEVADAERELNVLSAQLAQEFPRENEGKGAWLVTTRDIIVGDVQPALLVLFAGVGLVLVIASTNVASLLLSRGVKRQREIAVRMSLGAGRGRLVAQLLTESLVLVGVGATLGLLVATFGTPALVELARDSLPRADTIAVNGTVLGFTALAALVTAGLIGLAPAMSVAPARLGSVLSGARGSIAGKRASRLRRSLVVVEVAFALILLTAAGLLARSYSNLLAVPTGVNIDSVLTFRLQPSPIFQPDDRLGSFYSEIEERLAALPGVTAVATASKLPVAGGSTCTGLKFGLFTPDDDPYLDQCVEYRAIAPSYLQTMGLALVSGRGFTDADRQSEAGFIPPAGYVPNPEAEEIFSPALINESAERTFFPDGDALGRFVTTGLDTTHEIVGVVQDIPIQGLGAPPVESLYVPRAGSPGWVQRNQFVFLRTEVDPLSVLQAARNAVWEIDNTVPIVSQQTMEDVVASDVAAPRFQAFLLTTFASLATVLAAIGIGGLMADAVAQRTPEIAVRVALGAQPQRVVAMVVRSALYTSVAGIVLGIAGALATARLLSGMLFGIEPLDATTYLAVALALLFIVMTASYLPARRAARVDPARVLNSE